MKECYLTGVCDLGLQGDLGKDKLFPFRRYCYWELSQTPALCFWSFYQDSLIAWPLVLEETFVDKGDCDPQELV